MNIAKYVGQEYADCWDFVRSIYQDELAILIPRIPIRDKDIKRLKEPFTRSIKSMFCRVNVANNYDIAAIARKGTEKIDHCGIYFDGRILHHVKGNGVIYELPLSLNVEGYYVVRYPFYKSLRS